MSSPAVTIAAYRLVAIAEAVSWLGLLAGMYVKYVPETTEAGVQLFGPVHGAVFLLYVCVTLVVARVNRWPLPTTLLALAVSVPPLATLWFERRASRQGRLRRQARATA